MSRCNLPVVFLSETRCSAPPETTKSPPLRSFYKEVNANSFKSNKTHRVVVISFSLAHSQTPVHTARPQALHDVPVYSLLSPVLISPTHRGMARLS